MATGKKWRSNHTAWQQVHNWTKSENSELVMIAWWLCTITIPTPMTTWPLTLTSTLSTSTRTLECALSCFSCVSAHRHIAHTHRGSSRESCVCHPSHPHALMKWATLFDFALPFYLTHLLSHSFHFFPHLKLVDNLLRTPHKESMDLSDEFFLSTRCLLTFR